MDISSLETLFVLYARANAPECVLDADDLFVWVQLIAPPSWMARYGAIAEVSPTVADKWLFHCLEQSGLFVVLGTTVFQVNQPELAN
jgi:hypothetical protein